MGRMSARGARGDRGARSGDGRRAHGDAGRRRFLFAVLGGIAAGLFAEVAAILAAYLAPEGRGRSGRRVECGRADEFAPGEVRLVSEGRLFIVRRDDGFLALSQKCTHLACLVPWDAERGTFKCPCHGGTYDRDGVVLSGPPQRPLDLVSLRVVNGELIADTGTIVKRRAFAPDQVVKA
jgi:nitrite reductase/ring-hydroxylating ferredoxin subunit